MEVVYGDRHNLGLELAEAEPALWDSSVFFFGVQHVQGPQGQDGATGADANPGAAAASASHMTMISPREIWQASMSISA